MRFLAHEALSMAEFVYGTIRRAQKMAVAGNQTNALACLAILNEVAEREEPVIRGVIAAQEQAAQSLHRAMSAPLPALGRAEAYPDPANDDHTGPPEQPAPFVA